MFNVMNSSRGAVGTFIVKDDAVQEIYKDTNLNWDFAASGGVVTASCTDSSTTRNNSFAYKVLI